MSQRCDGFDFLSVPNAPLGGFSELLLRINGEAGTFLTIELVIDGERSRPLNYQPVKRGVLNKKLIGIAELEPVATPDEYYLLTDWIALR